MFVSIPLFRIPRSTSHSVHHPNASRTPIPLKCGKRRLYLQPQPHTIPLFHTVLLFETPVTHITHIAHTRALHRTATIWHLWACRDRLFPGRSDFDERWFISHGDVW